MVPPESAITLVPGAAVRVPAPQVVTALAGLATARFAGSVSVKARALQLTACVLVSVIVRVEGTPSARGLGLNALVILTPATIKLTEGEAAPAAGVCVVVTPDVALGCVPTVELETTTVTVQLPPAGIVIALNASAGAPLTGGGGSGA